MIEDVVLHTFQMPTNSSRRSFTISACLSRISWFGYTVMVTLQGKRGTGTSVAAPATYGTGMLLAHAVPAGSPH